MDEDHPSPDLNISLGLLCRIQHLATLIHYVEDNEDDIASPQLQNARAGQ